MFTGIVQEIGSLKEKQEERNKTLLTFQVSKDFLSKTKVGDSIAVDGVCLTVVEHATNIFKAEAIPETLASTTIGFLQPGKSHVNLEKALLMGDQLGGHLMAGHVDEKAQITSLIPREDNYLLTLQPSPGFLKQLVVKGSVAVDGISLTIQKITEKEFEIGIIPHTWKATALQYKREGDWVNLEVDLFFKYVKQALALR